MKRHLLFKSLLLLCALVVGSTSAWATDKYVKVTSTADLVVNGEYLLVSGTQAYSGVSSNIGQHVKVTFTENDITDISTAHVLKLGGSAGAWTFYDETDKKYIAYTSTSTSSNNKLYQVTSNSENGATWTLTVSTTAIKFKNNYNTGRWMRYNSDRFCCYYSSGSESTTGSAVTLYKKYVESSAVATTVTIDHSGITNTNRFLGTAAGTLTASVAVTSTSATIDGASVTWSSDNTSVATVDAGTGAVTLVAEGKAKITASYAGVDDTYSPATADYELTVTNEDPNAVTLWSETFDTFSKGGTYNYNYSDSNTKTYDQVLAGGTSPELLLKAGDTFSAEIPLENIKGDLKLTFKTNAKSITVSTTTDGISGSGTFSASGSHTVTFTGVTTSMTSITIKFDAGSDNVRLDDILLKGSKVVPVTISSTSGFATLYTPYAIDFSTLSSELKAYTATVSDNTVTLTEVANIPANTGVVLKGDVKTHDIPVINSSSTAQGALTGNTSAATAYNAFSGYDLYMLALNGGKAQFTLVNAGEIAAGKAFLKLANSGSGARELNVVFADDEATGVADVRCKMADGRNDFYNLNGQKVLNPTKGLYIVNGKKVVIK